MSLSSPVSGEVATSARFSNEVRKRGGDGGRKRRGRSLRFQIMIHNLLTTRLGLSPSVAGYRDTKALLAAARPKRQPETGEGGSPYAIALRSGGRFVLAICLVAPLLAACESAPVTGRSQLMLVSEGEERQMGLLAYQQVLAKEQTSQDGVASELVDKVGKRIATAAEHPPPNMWKAPRYNWEFRTISKNVPNAFCLPGGKIA